MKNINKTVIKFAVITAISATMIGCGGGGGGGGGGSNVRPSPATQFSNAAPVVSVPNSKIAASTGTTDPYFMAGGGYGGNVVTAANSIYPDGVNIEILGKTIRGNFAGDGSITVPNPPRDIRTAFRNGWTGKGVNILIADGFTNTNNRHGITVAMSAAETAPNATVYASDVLNKNAPPFTNADGSLHLPLNTRIDVINMSIGARNPVTNPNTPALRAGYLNNYNYFLTEGSLTNIDDAVLVKSAGNEAVDAQLSYENYYLVQDTDRNIKDRILIVGALNKYAQKGGAAIASYSNLAGNNEAVKRRFLVEYGGSPFGQSAFLCDGNSRLPDDCSATNFASIRTKGTSFAAPRVSGLAALVRHKFTNLSGAQTAKILLDTATTQGLACHPNCNSAVYGQGRVNITDALSPIGKLR